MEVVRTLKYSGTKEWIGATMEKSMHGINFFGQDNTIEELNRMLCIDQVKEVNACLN